MEILIDIPEHQYNNIMTISSVNLGRSLYKGVIMSAVRAIQKGTVLPKGHGDLKDISKIDYQSGCFVSSKGEPIPIIHKIATIEMIRDWLPTIIEADMREVEDE